MAGACESLFTHASPFTERVEPMSTAPPLPGPPLPGSSQSPKPPRTPRGPREIKLVSHSPIFYWWPIWLLGYVLALIT
jgi:hypothetical protein